MKIAYFDLSSGVAGDMIVGALLDSGLDASALLEGLKTLKLDGYTIEIEKVWRSSIKATHFKVQLKKNTLSGLPLSLQHPAEGHVHHGHHHEPHRNLFIITEIIQESELPEQVKKDALQVFYRLGEAEARVHGISIDQVHFHEVGAIDSIVDIVASCYAFYLLGIEKIYFSEFSFGSGSVKCAHGMMPVPVPATINLTQGYSCRQTKAKGELTTPTGAAIVTALGIQMSIMPSWVVQSIGYGAGTRLQTEVLGAVRVFIGEMPNEDALGKNIVISRKVAHIVCNLDDMPAEHIAFLVERLWSVSKQDIWVESIHMKKNRLATQVNILAEISELPMIQEILFKDSTSFGFRFSELSKVEFERKSHVVTLDGFSIRVKECFLRDATKIAPEYEDCRRYAEERKIPLQEVYFLVKKMFEQ